MIVVVGRVMVCALCCGALAAQTPMQAAAPDATTAVKVDPADSKPLPDLASLVERAKAHADANDELLKSYISKETAVRDEFDSKGNKKGSHTDEYRVFFVQTTEIHQHVSHDGKQLSPDDERKEQQRVDKQVAEVKAKSEKPQKGVRRSLLSSLLRMTTVSNARREALNGRPTIVFDYRGNDAAKAANEVEEIMKKLTGTLWIDEADAAIAKLNGSLIENFHIAGGLLVNIKKDSHFSIESERINDEIWFFSKQAGHVDGRILLFKGLDGDFNYRFSDYRKMKSSIKILPGVRVLDDAGQPLPDVVEQVPPAAAPQTPKP